MLEAAVRFEEQEIRSCPRCDFTLLGRGRMLGSQPVRYCAAALFFLLGVAALDRIPNTAGFDDLRETPLRWLLVLPAVLILLAAYGMFRRLALARYSMYALLTV